MARGKWTTSYRDRAKAQYQADQIAQATAPNLEEIKRQAWQEGYAAGYQAGREACSTRRLSLSHGSSRRPASVQVTR